MKKLLLLAIVSLLSTSCAMFSSNTNVSPDEAKEAVVGKWRGIGMANMFPLEINSDYTFTADFERIPHQWAYVNGEYRFYMDDCEEGKVFWSGQLNKDGILEWNQSKIEKSNHEVECINDDETYEDPLLMFYRAPEQPITSTKAPEGEWIFAFIRKSLSPPVGPPFDIMEFKPDGIICVTFSTLGKQFGIKSVIADNVINVPLTGEPARLLIGHNEKLFYRWEDGENTLIITDGDPESAAAIEYVYLRADRMPACDLTGVWNETITGERPMQLEVKENGLIIVSDSKQKGQNGAVQSTRYYRPWESPFGKAITIGSKSKEMQMIQLPASMEDMLVIEAPSFIYKIDNDTVKFYPIELEYGLKMTVSKKCCATWKKVQAAMLP
ncbi:hypothetical protein JXA32_04485 [Candidatus Sumerlaeota bacterium]|nr:hypothetical protein [Candidatus Sumerlaeota bacterium]